MTEIRVTDIRPGPVPITLAPTDWDDQVYVRTMMSRLVQIGRNAQHGSTPDVDDLRVLDDAEKLLGRGR